MSQSAGGMARNAGGSVNPFGSMAPPTNTAPSQLPPNMAAPPFMTPSAPATAGLLGPAAYARGNSADQAQLIGMVGQDQAHQMNNFYGPGGQGFDPQGYGTGTADLASGNYGIDTLMGPTRQAYEQAGVINGGKWAKRQDAMGNWIPL